jgi:hypothetical protein
MRICGFTIVRNAVRYDYPITEAIRSILPLCDQVLVAVGKSEDNTLQLIQSLEDPKIRILESEWDLSLREGGKVLAQETNKAMDAIEGHYDWLFYIQADEVVHEEDLDRIYQAMKRYVSDPRVEGLRFRYLHFYGSYDYVAVAKKWYKYEVRIIRQDPEIRSYRDAQGFRKKGSKLLVRDSGGRIFHYGWVRPPEIQKQKAIEVSRFWHDDAWIEKHIVPDPTPYKGEELLERFQGTHPKVMAKRIASANWTFHYDPKQARVPWKYRLLYWLEKHTGIRPFEYRNYRLLEGSILERLGWKRF